MKDEPIDYARMAYRYRRHHARFARYVETNGLTCQACGGYGETGSRNAYYFGGDPPEPCGWCETTGKVTRWLRGLWLRYHREEKRRQS